MAKTKSSATRSRPTGVPESARFDPKGDDDLRWVDGKLDAQGKEHGLQRLFYDDGKLHRLCTYVHGVLDGDDEVFHPDGTRALFQSWKKGVPYEVRFYRSRHPSPHEEMADVGPAVWEARNCSTDGLSTSVVLFFDAKGREILEDGTPMPKRPKGVPAEALFRPSEDAMILTAASGRTKVAVTKIPGGHWVQGAGLRSNNAPVGEHRTWTAAGKLSERRVFDDSGQPIEVQTWTPAGKLKEHTRTEKGLHIDETFFDDGSLWKRSARDADGNLVSEKTRRSEKTLVWKKGQLQTVVEREGKTVVLELAIAAENKPKRYDVRLRQDGWRAIGTIDDRRVTGTWKIFDTSSPKKETLRTEIDLTLRMKETDAIDVTDAASVARGLKAALFHHLEPQLPSVPELAGIDGIPWKKLETSRMESLKNVPRLLRGLTAPDPLVREWASINLEDSLSDDGDIWEGTTAARPFLEALAKRPGADKKTIRALLAPLVKWSKSK